MAVVSTILKLALKVLICPVRRRCSCEDCGNTSWRYHKCPALCYCKTPIVKTFKHWKFYVYLAQTREISDESFCAWAGFCIETSTTELHKQTEKFNYQSDSWIFAIADNVQSNCFNHFFVHWPFYAMFPRGKKESPVPQYCMLWSQGKAIFIHISICNLNVTFIKKMGWVD